MSGTEQKKGVSLDELQEETRKLLALLEDRHEGLMSWSQFLHDRLKNMYGLVSEALGPVPESWQKLLEDGWIIQRTSCTCGGNWAWMKPRPSGAYEMHGCVCHNTPPE